MTLRQFLSGNDDTLTGILRLSQKDLTSMNVQSSLERFGNDARFLSSERALIFESVVWEFEDEAADEVAGLDQIEIEMLRDENGNDEGGTNEGR